MATNNAIDNKAPSGITFGTSGGTPAVLNYYEEYTSSSVTFSGIWAAAQTATVLISQIGKIITLRLTGVLATQNNTAAKIAATNLVPTRFCTGDSMYFPISITNNGTGQIGVFQIGSTGNILIETAALGNFSSGSMTGGWNEFGCNWRLA
jgi:hypothetical protein